MLNRVRRAKVLQNKKTVLIYHSNFFPKIALIEFNRRLAEKILMAEDLSRKWIIMDKKRIKCVYLIFGMRPRVTDKRICKSPINSSIFIDDEDQPSKKSILPVEI